MLQQDILSNLPILLMLTSYTLICTNIQSRYTDTEEYRTAATWCLDSTHVTLNTKWWCGSKIKVMLPCA